MASNSSLLLLITILSLTLLFSVSAARSGRKGGEWQPIIDPNENLVVEIGKFAVSEHNKVSKEHLIFQKVVKGEFQVVTGTNYRLVIAATSSASSPSDNYLAIVWDKPWQHFRQLTSFNKKVKN